MRVIRHQMEEFRSRVPARVVRKRSCRKSHAGVEVVQVEVQRLELVRNDEIGPKRTTQQARVVIK